MTLSSGMVIPFAGDIYDIALLHLAQAGHL